MPKTTDAVALLHEEFVQHDPEMQDLLLTARVAGDVAEKIYSLRKAAGLTQKQLAKLIGTTASAISRLEAADYQGYTFKILQRLATTLGCSLEIVFKPFPRQGDVDH